MTDVHAVKKFANDERGTAVAEYMVFLFFLVLISIAIIYILQPLLAGTEEQGYANGFFSRIARTIGGFGFMEE